MRRSIFIFGTILIILLVRYYTFTSWQGEPLLLNDIGQKVELEGIIVEEPAKKETYTQLIVQVAPKTKILVYDDAYSHRQYGDKVLVQGKLARPENFQSENGRTFNYIRYLQKDRIFYLIKYADVSLIETGQGNLLKSGVLKIKKKFTTALDNSLPFPESKLAGGLIVAGKHALPKDIQEQFIVTGTVQVVVLSGYNVTLIAETIILFLSTLPRFLGASLGAISIIFFAIAAGGSATIVRAVIMVLIALLGKTLKKQYDVGRALIAAALLMLLHNPMLLVFDPSFQLSFLATIGLVYMTPLVEGKLSFVSEKFNVRNILASTTATQIFVTPFLLYLTGNVSIVALPANLALVLITPGAMLMSFISGITEMFFGFLTVPISFVTFLFLKAMLTTVHIFSAFPFASVSIHSFPAWCVTLFYLGFAVLIFRYSKKQNSPPV